MNVLEIIEAEKEAGGILDLLPDEYDLRVEDALVLNKMDILDAIYDAYLCGFVRGVKAERGED